MPRHSIVHLEIPAEDREQTAKFYHDVFGWTFHHLPGPKPYTLFETGNLGGGYSELDEQMYRGNDVILYVESEDLDADLQRAVDLGATVLVGKSEVPGFGQYAIFRDPTGNRMALWKRASPPHP